jgi:hypothetical protein
MRAGKIGTNPVGVRHSICLPDGMLYFKADILNNQETYPFCLEETLFVTSREMR